MKAMVTGGAGFIGSHIVDRLLEDGHEVVVIDDLSTGHRTNLPDHPRLTFVEADVRDAALVDEHMAGVAWVFHKAAIASVQKTIEDPVSSAEVNYQGTLNVLEAARKHSVSKVVFASSAALYGDEPTLPKQEAMRPVTLSPYAVDKLASEYACTTYTSLYGLNTVCLRYFNVYGPRQDPSSPYSGVISIFNQRLDKRSTPKVFGDGEQTRDFVYVGDVVEANMRAVATSDADGRFMNIATGKQTTLNDLLQVLCSIKGLENQVEYLDRRKGDIRHSFADISAARSLLGWAPNVDLRTGLQYLCDSLGESRQYG